MFKRSIALLISLVMLLTAGAFAQGDDWSKSIENWHLELVSIADPNTSSDLYALAKGFAETYPDFSINVTEVQDLNLKMQYVLTDPSLGYDMFWVQRAASWKALANAGVYMDLGEIYERQNLEGVIGKDICDIYKNDAGVYCGACECIVWTGVMYVNNDIFDELGLKVPATFDELYEVAPKIKAAGYGVAAINQQVCNLENICLRVLGKDDYMKLCDTTIAKDFWKSEEMVKVFEEYKKFYDEILVEGSVGSNVADDVTANLFLNKKVAMVIGESWTETYLKDADFNWSYAIMPDYREGEKAPVMVYYSNSMGILNATPNGELCRRFLEYVVSVDGQTALVNNGLSWPSRSDLPSAVFENASVVKKGSVTDMAQRGTVPLFTSLMGGSFEAQLTPNFENYLLGITSMEETQNIIAETVIPEGY